MNRADCDLYVKNSEIAFQLKKKEKKRKKERKSIVQLHGSHSCFQT